MIVFANKNHPTWPTYFILTILSWIILLTGGCAQLPASLTPTEKLSEPPESPILRLETGMHTAQISQIGMDAAERYLVTSSWDKTLRVWDIATGNLIRTMRPPIDQKEDGKLSGVAVSSDGRVIATGGWTGWNWGEKHNTIYIFDLGTGRLIHLITGLPATITMLYFSMNGQFLAACLYGIGGVQVYETTTWTLVSWDKQYGDNCVSADFDTNGRMVTSSYDAIIRLYDSSFQSIAKVTAPGGKQPKSARFSPDGLKIAVCYRDTNKIDILSGKDLTSLYHPDVTGVSSYGLFSICWSTDGRYLYAGGRSTDNQGNFLIRKWSLSGKGSFTDQAASLNSIMDIHALQNGGIIYGSADPAFGVFDSAGNRSIFVSPFTANFLDSRDFFYISPDGSAVRFSFERKGKMPAQFSISSRTLTLYSENSSENSDMISPRISASLLSITDWKNKENPKLNGYPLKLKKSLLSG